jgi:hypothetical protein
VAEAVPLASVPVIVVVTVAAGLVATAVAVSDIGVWAGLGTELGVAANVAVLVTVASRGGTTAVIAGSAVAVSNTLDVSSVEKSAGVIESSAMADGPAATSSGNDVAKASG